MLVISAFQNPTFWKSIVTVYFRNWSFGSLNSFQSSNWTLSYPVTHLPIHDVWSDSYIGSSHDSLNSYS